MKIGRRTLISTKAAARWRAEREAREQIKRVAKGR